ncbi:MAG TPA: hypothetical protein VGC56_15735 [Allosphingosinicella sp.]|jgi:hypothetical protein
MNAISLLVAALATPNGSPPDMPVAARLFLDAVATGNLDRARATLTQDVLISDQRGLKPVSSKLKAFVEHIRGCRRTDASTDYHTTGGAEARAAVVVHWTCPSRGTIEAFVWTAGRQVAAISFFAATAE